MTQKTVVGLFRIGSALCVLGLLVFGASCLAHLAMGGQKSDPILQAMMISFALVAIGVAIAALAWTIEDREADKRRREMFGRKE